MLVINLKCNNVFKGFTLLKNRYLTGFTLLNKKFLTGFTLIELLIVLGIMVMLFMFGLPLSNNFQIHSQLTEVSDSLIQTIRTAKIQSLAGINNSQYGVRIATENYILYQGESFDSRNQDYDILYDVGPVISISASLLNNEVNFSKDLGVPDNTGEITLTHKSGETRIININSLGTVEEI